MELFSQDVGNKQLHFPNLKKVCDERNNINISNFIKYIEIINAVKLCSTAA